MSVQEELKQYRTDLIKRISDVPPVFCPEPHQEFVLRGDRGTIDWNMDMLLDPGIPLETLRTIAVISEKASNKHIN